jgi:hypothetical protein
LSTRHLKCFRVKFKKTSKAHAVARAMNLMASRTRNMKKINDRFEAVRGKATVKWRIDELMQILRGGEPCSEPAERGIETSATPSRGRALPPRSAA